MKRAKELPARILFMCAACVCILAVMLICVFLLANGVPAMSEIGAFNFLLGETWRPGNDIYGIMPMILGSVYVTAGALIVGVPIGTLTAVYLSKFAARRAANILKPAISLLSGIPSVVFGFFALVVLVPVVREVFGGTGLSMFTASLLLGIMILPTIVTVSESAINAVPESYYEAALALGATHERAVFRVMLPAARSGMAAALILGVGRAVGEAMAVKMIAGNQARMPEGMFEGVRTLTTNIVLEMGYAADLHRGALIATGVVLFVFILIINLLFSILKRRPNA